MDQKNRRLLTPALVITGCLALFVVLIGLTTRDGAGNDSAAIGFPVVLVVLAVLAVVGAFVWKAVAKRKADHR